MMTLDFYDQHGDDFFQRTVNLDLAHIYEPFLETVPDGGHILDAGCGSGRDAKYFLEQGYQVTAFDGSTKMAQLAREYTGLDVLHRTFDQIEWANEFDAIWANASLLHLPMLELLGVFKRLAQALKPNGIVYASFKWGQGNRIREDGRHFTYCDDTSFPQLIERFNQAMHSETLEAALYERTVSSENTSYEDMQASVEANALRLDMVKLWRTADDRPQNKGEFWLNVLLQKHGAVPYLADVEPYGAVTKDIFEAQKTRRFGTSNPEVMDLAFWKLMIRNQEAAYWARMRFRSLANYTDAPIWCFQRFGMSETNLADGRIVYIAGEHEDYYDPDFCIYNDVIVIEPHGAITIYGYPRSIFPPTDFHSATLVGNSIYIIGSLGYKDERIKGYTPVYCLNLDTFAIEKIETTGEMPGWISKHNAEYDAANHTIKLTDGELIMQWNGEQREVEIPGLPDLGIEPTRYTQAAIPESEASYSLALTTHKWKKLS